jgi:hypothetical protein
LGFTGVAAFTQLTDAPRSYAGQALKVLRVRAGQDGLEFTAGLPVLELGAGFNFLKVSQLGGNLFAEWADIQGLIIALTGALNRLITPPELLIPAPAAAQVSLAASDPPGRTAFRGLLVPAPAAGSLAAATTVSGQAAIPALAAPVPAVSVTAQLV